MISVRTAGLPGNMRAVQISGLGSRIGDDKLERLKYDWLLPEGYQLVAKSGNDHLVIGLASNSSNWNYLQRALQNWLVAEFGCKPEQIRFS